jgi:maltooligosyltrehalose trehalohydrolase
VTPKPRSSWTPTFGASVSGDEVRFRLWAPNARAVDLVLDPGGSEKAVGMEGNEGVYEATLQKAAGLHYLYALGDTRRADPASLYQPNGVHGPSQAIDCSAFPWSDAAWRGVPLRDLVIYEAHVGTFTREGTFEGIISRLGYLKEELGVNCLELMPVGQFPGSRDWGYDGVFIYAAQNSYGGPVGLFKLVDACHSAGLAVMLDVVYNHIGPEGNHLGDFGPYFTSRYRTPWGGALNFDGDGSDNVRRFVIDNALHWTKAMHIDGLRLDAVHAIFDGSPTHILKLLGEEVRASAALEGRRVHVIAESDLNDARIVRSASECGYGLDAQWSDDMHHALHSALTGERHGYYQDYLFDDLADSFSEPFILDGRYSKFRGRRHGAPSTGMPSDKFVVFAQNHDQVGNRSDGARLTSLVGPDGAKTAAAAIILSPYLPLLFMGEEYGETAPFHFFTDYSEPEVVSSTREGRRRELEAQGGEFVDPQDPRTLRASMAVGPVTGDDGARATLRYYSSLIRFRRAHVDVLMDRANATTSSSPGNKALAVKRGEGAEAVLLVLVLGNDPAVLPALARDGGWRLELSSSDKAPPGLGSGGDQVFPPRSASVYVRGERGL